MKRSALKTVIASVGFAGVCTAVLLVSQSASVGKGSFDTLGSVSTLELPQAAAKIVSETPKADQAAVVRQVLEKVSALSKPGLTPVVVNAICRATPSMAPEAVAAAIALQPSETLYVIRAGLHAAPQSCEAIVTAVCREMPQAYAWTAVMASQEAPAAQAQILKAISSTLPTLATPVAKARTYCAGRSMEEIMHKTHELALSEYQDKVAQLKRKSTLNAAPSTGDSFGTDSSRAASVELASLNAQSSVSKSRTAAQVKSELPYLDQPVTGENLNAPAVQGPPRVGLPFTPVPPLVTERTSFQLPQSATRTYSAP